MLTDMRPTGDRFPYIEFATLMADPSTEQSIVDERGIRPPSVFAIEERDPVDGIAVLVLCGEFDIAAAPALRDLLANVRAAAPRGVVLDMTGATFLDSSALRELLSADAELRGDGVLLVLAALQPAVERLLELTRTTGMLAVAPTLQAALQRAAGGG
jgi:anti-sigma B factor antagonist